MNVQLCQRLLATTLLGSFAYASPAFAQAAPPSATPEVVEQAAEAAEPASDTEIVVTGSRISRPDLESASPIAVVGKEEFDIQAGAANVENILNDLPQVTATSTATSNNPGGGVATVNLRGLGSQRTLVMVDGRRYVSFDVNQIIDLNTIPASLIERVDIVTGGQSAVYGSDAIAGVVNFILNRRFTGVQLDSEYTVTERGDGQIFDVGLTIGTNFDDNRGNVTVYGGYTKRKPTFAGERARSTFALFDSQNGSPLFVGGSGSTPEGRINIAGLGAASGLGCNNQTFLSGQPACSAASNSFNFSPDNYLQVPQERFLISAMGEYEISEHFRPYFEGQFINNRVNSQLAATPISAGTPFGDGVTGGINLLVRSPFLPVATQNALAILDAAEAGALQNDGFVRAPSFNFRTVAIGPRANFDERNAYRMVAGMKGDLLAGFNYDGYFMYARTKNSQRQLGNVAIDRFLQATSNNIFLNPLTGATSVTPLPGFEIACGDAGARAAGCFPADIFGRGDISQAATDRLGIGATNLEEYTTQVASIAFTNNDLFDLGAGGVGVAFGAEYRKENGAVTPDTFLASGNVAGFNPGQPTAGGYSVKELFAETRVPLLRESFIHLFELNGAVRSSTYSNAPGNVISYSAGAQLAPTRDLTFRGQYAKTVRGPSVNELFLGNTVSFNGNADQCGTAAAIPAGSLRDICLAQGVPVGRLGDPLLQDPTVVNPLTFIGGNSDLLEESAKTFTVGVVLQPRFVPRFTATADYYEIRIDGFVGGVGTETIGNLCFVDFNESYCDRITRNPLGEIDSFTDTLSNSGGYKTSGVDFSAGYYFPLGRMLWADSGRLSFSYQGTYLMRDDYTPVIGVDTIIKCDGKFGAQCGVPKPRYRHTLRTTLGLGPVRLSGQWRHLGAVKDDDDDTTYAVERIKAFDYFDATSSFDIGDHYEFNLGVSNIFDKKPPFAATTQLGGNGEQSNTFPTVYDVLGRSFFVAGKLKF